MGVAQTYSVKSIDAFQCKEWLLYKHYAKRVPAIEYSFGLFSDSILIGVCTFGPPPRVMNNGESIFKNLRIKTLELNRLIVEDNLPKNTLSYFVSRCIKMLPSPCCLVSYADHSFGHTGYIYQATNWIYTGYIYQATNWIYTGLNQIHERQIFYLGKEIHPRTACSMGFTSISDWALKDKNVTLVEYTQKHRYLFFTGSKKQRNEMLSGLIYNIKPYPKNQNKRYDSSYKTTSQLILFVDN